MTVFLDSSALLKLYADEPESEQVAQELGPAAVSALALVEVVTALWRKARTGGLPSASATGLAGRVRADLSRQRAPFGVVDLSHPVLMRASRLAERHQLRSADLVQLACALTAREADPSCSRFLSFDLRLRDAARAEGFEAP